MKYAFLFLIISFSQSTFASHIKSFNDSQAILTIAQFMIDNAEDMPTSVRLSDVKLKVKDEAACTVVTPAEVLKEVHSAIKKVLKLYPDEELPLEEAMSDLLDYLGPGPLSKCIGNQEKFQGTVQVVYFYDSTDSIHVKVETISRRK
jgi:hypothetical protein